MFWYLCMTGVRVEKIIINCMMNLYRVKATKVHPSQIQQTQIKKNGLNVTRSIRYCVKWGIEKEPCLLTQAIHSPSMGIQRAPLMTILVTIYQCSTDETPTFSEN